jgi:hypothetical protein
MRLEAVGRLAPLLFDGEGRLTGRSASPFMNALFKPRNAEGAIGMPTPTGAGGCEADLCCVGVPRRASTADAGAPADLGGGCAAGEDGAGGAKAMPSLCRLD